MLMSGWRFGRRQNMSQCENVYQQHITWDCMLQHWILTLDKAESIAFRYEQGHLAHKP